MSAQSQMSFREYLAQRRVGDNPAGDFILDARQDPRFPDAQNWSEIEFYLDAHCHACDDAMRAARKVWLAYRRQTRVSE